LLKTKQSVFYHIIQGDKTKWGPGLKGFQEKKVIIFVVSLKSLLFWTWALLMWGWALAQSATSDNVPLETRTEFARIDSLVLFDINKATLRLC